MNASVFRWLVWLLCCLVPSLSYGQASAKERFVQCIDRLEAGRSQVLTYAVDIRERFLEKSFLASNHNFKLLMVYDLRYQIVADVVEGKTLVLWGVHDLRRQGAQGLNPIFLANSEGEFRSVVGRFHAMERGTGSQDLFDPLALGLGYSGELYSMEWNLKTVANAYRQFQIGRMEVLEDERLIRFRDGIEPDHEECVFDKTQSYSLVFEKNFSGSACIKRCEFAEYEGIFLPKRVYYEYGETRRLFDLNWVMVNQPLPAKLFDRELVTELFSPSGLAGEDPAGFDEAFLLELLR
jgi:hypothetical protein